MNEPSNFVEGSTKGCPANSLENPPYTPGETCSNQANCKANTHTSVKMWFVFFLSGILGGLLRAKTVCATAQQKLSTHYNLHSLYGLMEAKATARWGPGLHTKRTCWTSEDFLCPFMTSSACPLFPSCSSALKRILAKRPFVVSRATFASQGMYSAHWLGDNRSHWKDMYRSIAGQTI